MKQAWRSLLTKAHPDKGGDPARFEELREAFDVLSDDARRSQYDRTGVVVKDPEQHFADSFGAGTVPKRGCMQTSQAAGGAHTRRKPARDTQLTDVAQRQAPSARLPRGQGRQMVQATISPCKCTAPLLPASLPALRCASVCSWLGARSKAAALACHGRVCGPAHKTAACILCCLSASGC